MSKIDNIGAVAWAAGQYNIAADDAERVVAALDCVGGMWGCELPTHGGVIDETDNSNKFAGHSGYWAAWADNNVIVSVTNGDAQWGQLDCEDDINAAGGDWDDVAGWLAQNISPARVKAYVRAYGDKGRRYRYADREFLRPEYVGQYAIFSGNGPVLAIEADESTAIAAVVAAIADPDVTIATVSEQLNNLPEDGDALQGGTVETAEWDAGNDCWMDGAE